MRKEMFDTIDSKILRTFQIVKKVGQGAYGQVWKAKDKKTSTYCALKKIYDAFRNSTDAQRAYREIKYLQKLSHPNIIKIISFFKPENTRDIYIALQYMQADLCTAIKNNVLREIHKHFIFFQITQAVNYLHSAQLIHRDLKPSNILVNESCEIKLCDFGLIRSLVPSEGQSRVVLTQNIATRWYRAPQILLCSNTYGKQIDIWSLGCILAEIFLGRPLFQGTSSISQLQKIFEVTGKPSREQLIFVRSEASRSIVQSMTVTKRRSLHDIFYKADKQFIDLLENIFQINPKKRITIEEIVKHPFVNRFKGRTQDRKIMEPIKIKYQTQILSPDEYRLLLYNQLQQKSYPSELNTAKNSEMSTFYESSITHSLPNNSRQQFFNNNCPLGRPDKPSPQRQNNLQNRLLPISPFQSLQEIHKMEKDKKINQTYKKPEEASLKYQTQIKIQKNINFPFNSQNNLSIFRQKSNEKPRIFKTPDLNVKRTFTPFKIKQNSPSNRHHSNQKIQNIQIQRAKSPIRRAQFEKFLKVPQENPDKIRLNNHQRRGSPSPSPVGIKYQTIFHPNRTIGPRQQFRREKIVPKFILEGRKKFRSRSPHQLVQKIAPQEVCKNEMNLNLPSSPINHSFKPKAINNRLSGLICQFQNQVVSPQSRQNIKNFALSPNGFK